MLSNNIREGGVVRMKLKSLLAVIGVSTVLTGCSVSVGDKNWQLGGDSEVNSIVEELETDVISTIESQEVEDELNSYRDSILKTLTDNVKCKSTSGFMNIATVLSRLSCQDIDSIDVQDKADTFAVKVVDVNGLEFSFSVTRDKGLCRQIYDGNGNIVWDSSTARQ